MKKRQKKNNGITILSLVITIIIILILSGISIGALTGEHGVITMAKKASEKASHQEIYEALHLLSFEYAMEEYEGTLMQYLLEKKEVIYQKDGIEGYIVNVENLLGRKSKYGNGKNQKSDVYKIEDFISTSSLGKVATASSSHSHMQVITTGDEKVYQVLYYGKKEQVEEIGRLKDIVLDIYTSNKSNADDTDENNTDNSDSKDNQQNGSSQNTEQPKEPEIKTITFKITDEKGQTKQYTCKEGMTWAEFCSSEYNTEKFFLADNGGVSQELIIKNYLPVTNKKYEKHGYVLGIPFNMPDSYGLVGSYRKIDPSQNYVFFEDFWNATKSNYYY